MPIRIERPLSAVYSVCERAGDMSGSGTRGPGERQGRRRQGRGVRDWGLGKDNPAVAGPRFARRQRQRPTPDRQRPGWSRPPSRSRGTAAASSSPSRTSGRAGRTAGARTAGARGRAYAHTSALRRRASRWERQRQRPIPDDQRPGQRRQRARKPATPLMQERNGAA